MSRDRDELFAYRERLAHGVLLGGHVASDRRRPDDATLGVVDRRDRHRDREPDPILTNALGAEVVHALAPT